MKDHKIIVALAIIIFTLLGCKSNSQLGSKVPPSFTIGLAAIERKDFETASFHFAELAKEGNPSSMNNLGVSLLMVDRKEEAIYWFKKASRYGDQNAKLTLKAMGEDIPPSDLVGQHPTQLQREETERIIINTLLGIAVGVTLYYASQGGAAGSTHSRSSIFNSIHQNKKIIPISAIQKQGCQCVCMDGEVSAICSSTLDVPPICSPRICPVMPLSVEPIQSLRISPIGTSNCVQKQIYDDNLYRYKWQEVCY